MTDTLRDQLQTTLGSAYTLERELGGGGMSRVFVAREGALGRDVVVKVLHPDLAGGVSVERFKREIMLAASLQHPHIVPILSAGDADGLPYFTMPFVSGRSLRERLAEQGAQPVAEAVSILRDVARALAFAHEQGIVHRDIKPDNVLLARGSATVTDFGVAKALVKAREEGGGRREGGGADPATGNPPFTGTTPPSSPLPPPPSPTALTGLGVSIGTPAYMAPEQAAGDPDVDHRADIYAFGCMAYELLAGRPPFTQRTPHRMLAAHLGEPPAPVTEHRVDTPPALAALVMRCLEKDPGLRPRSAAEILQALDAAGTPSAGAHEAVPAIAIATRRMLGRALALYAAAFVGVAVLARVAIGVIGLPDWVFPGALVVMALGLPVLLFTGFVHHQSRLARATAPTHTPGGSPAPHSTLSRLAVRARPHVSWRRAAWGGVTAVSAFALLVGGYMALRALGIGPAGSLFAKGVIGERERLLVADFRSPASDTTLGPVVTEAFRTDLAQSPSLVVVAATSVRDALRRMQRPPDARVDFALAREVATREGIKAVVDGEILALGGKYVLSARLVATQSQDELATFRETADDAAGIIPAIDRLSKAMRARIGESLKDVRETPPLEQVTTGSLEALKKYAQGLRTVEIAGDFGKARPMFEEAIALDTGFAMAYRKLAIELGNRGLEPARAQMLLAKAYEHRDRLTDRERYMTIGSYFQSGPSPDRLKAIAAYEALLEVQPDYTPALNNSAILYMDLHDFAKAEQYMRRSLSSEVRVGVQYVNLVISQLAMGRLAGAESTAAAMRAALPSHPMSALLRADLLVLHGHADSSILIVDSLRRARASELGTRGRAEMTLASYATDAGRLAEARRWRRSGREARVAIGVKQAALIEDLDDAWYAIWFRDDTAMAVRALDAALARHPLDSIPPLQRPYPAIARIAAAAGRPEQARAMVAGWDKARTVPALGDDVARYQMLGDIALAERRFADAIREYRAADAADPCLICSLPLLARAYDLAGNTDSATAVFDRYVSMPSIERSGPPNQDSCFLAGAHKRLGELYEARNQPGDRERAASHYATFVEMWKHADPELQSKVAEAKARLARLQAGGR